MRDRIAQIFVPLVVLVVGAAQLRGMLPLAAMGPTRSAGNDGTGDSSAGGAPANAERESIRRTMASMRTVARALDSYRIDNSVRGEPGTRQGMLPGAEEWTDVASLEDDLVPLYLTKLPKSDAWGWSIQYRKKAKSEEFALRSRGSDEVIDPALDVPLSPLQGGDIVFQDGAFRKDVAPLERDLDDADRQRLALEQMRLIGFACEMYESDSHFYPIVPEPSGLAEIDEILLPPDLMPRLPADDPWGWPYMYESADGKSYRIYSLGKDARPGPENLDPESPDPGRDIALSDGKFLLDKRAIEAINRRVSSDDSRCAATIKAMDQLFNVCMEQAATHDAYPDFTGWTDAKKLHLKVAFVGRDKPVLREVTSTKDGWGGQLQYRNDRDGRLVWVRSLGSDGFPGAPADAGPGDTRRDIVFKNGRLEEDGGCAGRSTRRTDAALRLIMTINLIKEVDRACQVYAVDHRSYPVSAGWTDVMDLPPVTGLKDRRGYAWTRAWLTLGDGWGHSLEYISAKGTSYTIRSLGKDGVEEPGQAPGPTDDLNADIVYSNGAFSSWPRRIRPELVDYGPLGPPGFASDYLEFAAGP